MSTYIIAEAGVNHNGSLDLAYKLIDEAINANANAVKFQTFQSHKLVQSSAGMADYQKKNTGLVEAQIDMLRRLELSHENHFKLIEYCKKGNIDFLSTPFDIDSINFLCEEAKLQTIKIPSGELTNAPYLYCIAEKAVNIILSTGMADLEEVTSSLDVLAYGLLGAKPPSSFKDVQGAASSTKGMALLKEKVTLLHCTTEYPAPLETINLKAMDTLANEFKLKVGLSDHSQGLTVPIAAVARGAVLIEKHFTLDRAMPGPDHKASLEPEELTEMVKQIRNVEIALGSGEKKPFPQELENRKMIRKGLYAARAIKCGETLQSSDLFVHRPEEGVSPMKYWDLINTRTKKDYQINDPIEE